MFLLCRENVANKDLLNVLRLQASAVDGSYTFVRQLLVMRFVKRLNIPLIA